jgi:alkanesulfonate monooxygenase SsuD/methylene tetrahydromethanopterin reductase-like flavin-dependent oxidoreductase (luciferase family)
MAETVSRLQLGLCLPTWEDRHGRAARWRELRELARSAEEAGLDSLWVPDHLLYRPDWGFRDGWTVLPAVAAVTCRVAIGTLVTCAAFRNPALLAKMASTVDEISDGRLVLGLGAGVPERDGSWRAFGYPTDHAVSRFAEAVEIVARLLREGRLTFQGRYYHVHDCELRPRGPRPEGPQFWIGGQGPRMLRLAARWADVFNLQGLLTDPALVAEPLARLDEACREAGRDPATLRRTGYCLVSFAGADADMGGYRAAAIAGTPEAMARRLHALHAAGVQHLVCIIDPGEASGALTQYSLVTPRALERFVRVMEALRTLETHGR